MVSYKNVLLVNEPLLITAYFLLFLYVTYLLVRHLSLILADLAVIFRAVLRKRKAEISPVQPQLRRHPWYDHAWVIQNITLMEGRDYGLRVQDGTAFYREL